LGFNPVKQNFPLYHKIILQEVYFTLIHALTFTEVRHSEPLHPILAVVIATAAGEIQRRLKLISQ